MTCIPGNSSLNQHHRRNKAQSGRPRIGFSRALPIKIWHFFQPLFFVHEQWEPLFCRWWRYINDTNRRANIPVVVVRRKHSQHFLSTNPCNPHSILKVSIITTHTHPTPTLHMRKLKRSSVKSSASSYTGLKWQNRVSNPGKITCGLCFNHWQHHSTIWRIQLYWIIVTSLVF